jgi:hypothetical protein
MTRWVAPVGDQLGFLVDWLEPILSHDGLERVPVEELAIELGEADAANDFEPFDALIGPLRAAPEGIVAGVVPVEPFEAIVPGAKPFVLFARGTHPELEFVASEAVLVTHVVAA